MTSKDETNLQIIATQNIWYRLANAVLGSLCSFFAAIFFIIAIFVTPLPVGDYVYFIPWILMIVAVVLALSRNIILHFIFGKMLHSRFLKLVYYGRRVHYILIISGFSFLIISFLINNVRLLSFSFGLLFTWMIMFFTFSEPLTYTGEIRLLFELLYANLDDFQDRQPYLRAISRKLEDMLKLGNIKVPHNEFVYYTNMELLEGTDIRNDLRNIEAWMVGEDNLNFESLSNIYPESELEPWRRISLSRQLAENPTIIRYAFYMVIIIILVAISPELRSEILRLLSKLLGI
jgi:hypothetical protein